MEEPKREGEDKYWSFSDGTLTVLEMVPDRIMVKRNFRYTGTKTGPSLWPDLCHQIRTVRICADATYIATGLFFGCGSLTGAAIPSGVRTICLQAFKGCRSLASVFIPASVSVIEADAFSDCYRLTDIYYGGSEEQWKQISIGSGNEALTRAAIHYND